MLLMTTVFLGFQLLMGGFQGQKTETRTPEQILANMRDMNAKGKDVTIQAENRQFQAAIQREAERLKWSESEKRKRLIEGWVLTIHTSLKAGVEFKNLGRASTAFNIADHERKTYGTDPHWNDLRVAVDPGNGLPETSFTAKELYLRTKREVDVLNRSDMVWGFFPGYAAIDALVRMTGSVPSFSYAFAAFLLALVVRAIVWPLAQKQLMFSKQMMQLQPLAQEIRKKHTDKNGQVKNPTELQRDTMALYAEYGINPMAGCFPMLLQVPLFLLVFQSMMHYRFAFADGTFLWMNPATSAQFGSWIAPNLGQMDIPLLVIYGVSMVVATYLQPVSDPNNAKQQRILGMVISVVVTISMFFFPLPSAFVLYWIFLNVFSTYQSLRAYRMPSPPLQKVATAAGGVRAKSGFFAKLMEEQQKALEAQLQEQKKKESKSKDTP